MIGADQSSEMLAEAWEKAMELDCEPPVFLNQPAEKLDLYGTIDACVSSLDSLNYVIKEQVLREAFWRVHTFLMPGGYFLFDVLAAEHLRQMDGQMFVDETDDVFCLWRTEYQPDSRTVVYGMDLFERDGDCWYREQEEPYRAGLELRGVGRTAAGDGLHLCPALWRPGPASGL